MTGSVCCSFGVSHGPHAHERIALALGDELVVLIVGAVVEFDDAGAGIVEFHHRAYNQENKLVAECKRNAFMRMRPK